ncbi:hypothetical protein F4777DRAFT_574131 [Nemania sp. FL0916]|nr:hypothetical protein F4777DRAFT_574131 [Nemania sp. FL0916]
MIFLTTAAVMSAICALVSGTPVGDKGIPPVTPFGDTCDSIQLELGYWTEAHCEPDDNYGKVITSIGLDVCIGNDAGSLVAQENGGFSKGCTNTQFIRDAYGKLVLKAVCKDSNGKDQDSSLTLDFIENNRGCIMCFGHKGQCIKK